MDITYAIIKVYITEHNDVIKRHSNVIAILLRSITEVTALLKNLRSEMKGVQEKVSIMGVRGRLKNLSLVVTVWHQADDASDPRDGLFYLPLTPMIDPYILASNITPGKKGYPAKYFQL